MIIYLIKFSACLAAFMVVYKLLLESESFHKFKRFYLLSAVILALTIPLVTFTSYVEPMPLETIPVTEVIQNQQEIPVSEYQKSNNLPIVLWSIYLIGLLVFGSKFVYNLSAIYRKIKQNPKHTSKSFIHVLLNDLIAPHTFFSYIFLNKKKYECQEIPQEVYIHEQAHAKQKHTLDILFIELMQVVFWFNPLIYFIKKDIKLNHEFLADDAVIKNGYSTAGYQKTLLAFSSHAIEPQLANAINYSSIKKRFTVMKTQTSKTTKWIKSLVLLPLLAVLIYSFSEREEVVKNHSNNGLKNELSNSYDISSKKNVVIMIQVNSVSINAKQSSIETFKDDLNTATKNWDDGDYASINPILKIASCTKEYLEKLNTEFKKTDYFKKSNQDLEITNPQQKGASKAQIAEYNKLAKHYNSQKGKNYTIKLSDMKRIKYLYDLMTEEQKKQAEPFPNFPPPPPPAPESVSKKERAEYESMAKKAKAGKAYSYKYKDENGKAIKVEVSERETKLPPPPPPPVPANATQEQKEKYKKTSEEYYKKYKVKNGKVERIKAPEPPEPPKSSEIIEVPMTVAQPPKAQQQYYDSLATFKYQGKLTKNKSGDNPEVIEVTTTPPKPENAAAEPKSKSPWGITTTVQEFPADKKGNKTPPIPSVHMKQLSEKNALFFYNKKSISSEEAIKLTNENHNLHIKVSNNNSNQPRVEISDRKPNIETAEIVEVPPPPPPPKSPLDHVIDMAKKGATFYYEGEKISSDKAIAVMKANKSMNISTKNADSKNPKVYLSKEPITIKNK